MRVAAQTGAAPAAPTLSVRSRLVVVDVVAVDRDGKPVLDLKPEELRVLEDGKPRPIVSFEPAVASEKDSTEGQAQVESGRRSLRLPRAARPSLTLLVVDELNTHFADSSFAARQVADYLGGQPDVLPQPAVLLTLTEGGLQVQHEATKDRQALLSALKSAPVKYAWKLETHNSAGAGVLERLESSVQALVELAEAYGRLEGRKDVIWVGAGFPTIDPDVLGGAERDQIRDTLRHVTNALLQAHMTVSVVDPSSQAAGMTEIADAAEMAFFMATGGSQAPDVKFFDPTEDFDGLAAVTGGRVIRGRNDVGQQIANAISAVRLPYEISYRPADDYEGSPRFRKLEIECLRPGVQMISRKGYFAGSGVSNASASATTFDLAAAETSRLPLHGIDVRAREIGNGAGQAHRYLLRVPSADLVWTPSADGAKEASVYIAAVSLSREGKVTNEVAHPMLAHAGPGADVPGAEQFAEFTIEARPAPKDGTMRFLVRDSSSGRIGAFDLKF